MVGKLSILFPSSSHLCVNKPPGEHGLQQRRGPLHSSLGETVFSSASFHSGKGFDSGQTFVKAVSQTRPYGEIQQSVPWLHMGNPRTPSFSNCIHFFIHDSSWFKRSPVLCQNHHWNHWMATFCPFSYDFNEIDQQQYKFVPIRKNSKNGFRHKQCFDKLCLGADFTFLFDSVLFHTRPLTIVPNIACAGLADFNLLHWMGDWLDVGASCMQGTRRN